MVETCVSVAMLDESQISKIRDLERDLGTHIMAVERTCHWADLSEDALRRLKETEQELGVMLLAYE